MFHAFYSLKEFPGFKMILHITLYARPFVCLIWQMSRWAPIAPYFFKQTPVTIFYLYFFTPLCIFHSSSVYNNSQLVNCHSLQSYNSRSKEYSPKPDLAPSLLLTDKSSSPKFTQEPFCRPGRHRLPQG